MIFSDFTESGDFSDLILPTKAVTAKDVVSWEDGGTLVVRFTADIASADIVGDVAVFGPVYAYSGGLKAKDGANTATVATSWAVGDVVTAVVRTSGSVMAISRDGEVFGSATPFDTTMPALALSPTAPGKLKSVQTWSKVATAQEINKVTSDYCTG